MDVLGSHTYEQWLARCAYFGWKCAYCRMDLTAETVTQDHMIPLSKGGTNWASNLAPACLPCNMKKHAIPFKEWLEYLNSRPTTSEPRPIRWGSISNRKVAK
jgi:5-methylcytosine-specific restriction endonuclease McrA